MRNTLMLLSGGIDSMVALEILRRRGCDAAALFVDYGQGAIDAEREAATKIAKYFDIELRKQSVAFPERYGAGEIPNRNGFLIFLAAVLGGEGIKTVGTGIHAGVPYPDCSEEFLHRIELALLASSGGEMSIVAPLRTWQKQEVIAFAVEQKLPLSLTYSCEASSQPCGICLSCKDRRWLEC
jgi:7-cyano-7-deazaguanine synthase